MGVAEVGRPRPRFGDRGAPLRTRARRVWAVACVALVAAPLLSTASIQAAPGDPGWGVLDAGCTVDRVSPERAAGLSVVAIEAHWDRANPANGVYDAGYLASIAAKINTCADAGMRVVLGSGVQYPPAWVRALPNAALRDQLGATPVTGQLDAVWNSGVVNARTSYLRQLVTRLPSGRVEGIRVGTSAFGEIGFPGSSDSGSGRIDSWWAYGTAAQNGASLASGQSRSPMPGWVPGQATWNGRAVTPALATSWFRWYTRALVTAITSQASALRAGGFTGGVHVPAAGRGVLPADLTAATNALLNGAGNRDDSLSRGLEYIDQFPRLASAISGVVIDLTSVDDASSVTARALNPPQDRCQLSDAYLSTDPTVAVADWSRFRFARAAAARAGVTVIGENPGPPAYETGGTPVSDPMSAQIPYSVGYARTCGLSALLLAFEADLFTGRSGVDLQDYADAIGP